MKVIITESQYKKILLEQSNVYTDEKKYKQELRNYNTRISQYLAFIDLYNAKDNWGIYFSMSQSIFSSKNLKNLGKSLLNTLPNDIPIFMDAYYRCLNNLDRRRHPGYKFAPEQCYEAKKIFKSIKNLKIEKWYQVKNGLWVPLFIKPNILKPIFKKLEPPTTVTQSLPTPVQPPKTVPPKSVPPPIVQSTLDKTKPVDFYFGNRILRAPNYEIAKKFAEKLAIRNLNSNQVFVYKDKNNERWFIGANDKIYFSQSSYNQDPNDAYVDPVKMGMIFI
jgi:hypothetical protein